MARIVKPILVARLEPKPDPLGQPIEQTPEQDEVLSDLIESKLEDEQIATLFGDSDEVRIVLRRPSPSERWIRADG